MDMFLMFAGAGFLHVCGGVSQAVRESPRKEMFSPRMWRCFSLAQRSQSLHRVFSTYVEVFLTLEEAYQLDESFLHVCGGVSIGNFPNSTKSSFSPRMWRCFSRGNPNLRYACVFSTYVEVFPKVLLQNAETPSFLHVCGGVSIPLCIEIVG